MKGDQVTQETSHEMKIIKFEEKNGHKKGNGWGAFKKTNARERKGAQMTMRTINQKLTKNEFRIAQKNKPK